MGLEPMMAKSGAPESDTDPPTLVGAFRSRMVSDPDATFLFDSEGNSLTYASAGQHALRLTEGLTSRTENPYGDERPIGLYLPNSWTWPVALLAVWSIGRSAACVGTQLKATEAIAHFQDVGVTTVIVEDVVAELAALHVAGVDLLELRVGREAPEILTRKTTRGEPTADSEAVVIFSSGTTGKPKVLRAGARDPRGRTRPRHGRTLHRQWRLPTLGEVVGAALIWKKGADTDTAAVAADLRRRVSGYKIPRVWVSLEELPLIGPGKADRRKIRSLLATEKSGQAVASSQH